MNDAKFGSFKCLMLKYRRGDQIIQPFCRIGSLQEIRSRLFKLRKLSKTVKSTAESCRMHLNLTNNKKFGSFKCLILKCRRGDQIIQSFCRIGPPEVVRSPLFNLKKVWKPDKSTAESFRMYWNLINDKEFGSFICLILKYRRGEPNNSAFLQNWFPQEIRSPLFNLRKF